MKTPSIAKATLLTVCVLSVITAVTLNSCQKEVIKPKTTVTKVAGGAGMNATSARVMSDLNNLIFSGNTRNEKGLIPNGISNCATITVDSSGKPITRTYNYGSGCTGSDGVTRTGVVVMSYDVPDMRVANNQITISYQNYGVSGTTINGYISVVNTGVNGNNNDVLNFTGSYTGVSASESDTFNLNYQYEWIAGENSSPAANWQFSVTGSITGASSNGKQMSGVITSALVKNAKNPNCNYYISGTEQYTEGSNPTMYVDFGNPGGCSGQEAVTQNGVTTIQNQ